MFAATDTSTLASNMTRPGHAAMSIRSLFLAAWCTAGAWMPGAQGGNCGPTNYQPDWVNCNGPPPPPPGWYVKWPLAVLGDTGSCFPSPACVANGLTPAFCTDMRTTCRNNYVSTGQYDAYANCIGYTCLVFEQYTKIGLGPCRDANGLYPRSYAGNAASYDRYVRKLFWGKHERRV